ncbi:hypothetical protein AALA00_13755 [Lachnospiraceae bacterium 46-15]
MKRKSFIIFVMVMLLLVGCSGNAVPQDQYESAVAERDELDKELKALREDYEKVKEEKELAERENKSLQDEKKKRVSEELELATPIAWATTCFGEDSIVFADNKEYLQIISKKKYNLTSESVQEIWEKTLEASKLMKAGGYLDKIVYDRIGMKFSQENGSELLEIVLKRADDTYELDSISGDLLNASALISAMEQRNQ